MQCEHPDFLPDAWRFSTVDETPAPVKNTLDFLETAFSALAKTLSDLRASRSIVTEISMKHGVQTIDPRGIAIIEFGMCIHKLTKLQMDELGSVLIKMSLHATDYNESLISELVYEVLSSISGLLQVLKTDVGNDIACVMGAIAAVYTPPSDSNKRVFDIVTRRIRNASRLSAASRTTDQNTRAVLLDAAADYGDDERIKTIVSIALGKNTPILDDQCPQWVLNERNAPHKRFQRYMERLNYCKGSWSLIDALIPCGCMPIRTKHYVVYVNAVYEYADRLASMLAPPSEHDDSPERRCAWTLLAMSNPVVQNEEYFENILRSWCIARAHEPPARGTSCWITVRALLSRPKMDIDALSAHVNEFVSNWTDSIEEQNDIFGRIATFCISTRSPNGLRLICKNSFVASGVLHRPAPNTPVAIECLSHSPSGVLELGEYESGFSEWSDDYDDDDDDSQQQQLATDVVEKIKEQILIVLRKDHSTNLTDVILRLTLLPDSLLSRQWKFALESIQPDIEQAICNETGGGCFSQSDEIREKALRAVVFRAKCLRALSASSSPQPRACNTALVTWYCDPFGRCIVFARLFAPKCTINDLETVVIEYERLIRKAAAVYDATEVASATHVYKSMRVSEIGLKHGAFLDDTSMRLLRNATLVKYCSSSAVICAATTAVSVVHWPVARR